MVGLKRHPLLERRALLDVRWHQAAVVFVVEVAADGAGLVELEIAILGRGHLAEGLSLEVLGRLVLVGGEVDGDDIDRVSELEAGEDDAGRAGGDRRTVDFDRCGHDGGELER